jgi:hypothetical protein
LPSAGSRPNSGEGRRGGFLSLHNTHYAK